MQGSIKVMDKLGGGSSPCDLIWTNAQRCPTSPALRGDNQQPCSYAELYELVRRTANQLQSTGLGRKDRVAIVLPNGPEMAACFLAVAEASTAAPLNPAFCRDEFRFYLSDLNAKALITIPGDNLEAVEAAEALDIPVIELTAEGIVAGAFTLGGQALSGSKVRPEACAQDTALVLHTSGTTSRPKVVPLTHANLFASAANISAWLKLTADDCCLNVMPLFHIHGLVGALLATLFSGGSVVCRHNFDASRFLHDLTDLDTTWYTAVPTMHQAILAACRAGGTVPKHGLRFIRSCSAPLPTAVLKLLEETFDVPVVEAYGMTEAAHQMTCNPLPPGQSKIGSVGLPTGIEVGIMGRADQLLPADVQGEVVVRGANVMGGYDGPSSDNLSAFSKGWFRTGDLGRMDLDGYLFLTGRVKEMINRGGEKISPLEIDDVLTQHPDVAQATAFAVPHATLSEDVAAAVVLHDGSDIAENELRAYAGRSLSGFKVPRQIVFVDRIPKGPTGKPQRIGLAKKLGLVAAAAGGADAIGDDRLQTDTERKLHLLWQKILIGTQPGRQDNFFNLGGNSLLAAQLIAGIQDTFSVELPIRTLFAAGTIAQLAQVIDTLPKNETRTKTSSALLVPFQSQGPKPPFFFVHGVSGRSFGLGFFAPYLDEHQPYYGFVARGMDGAQLPHKTIQDMASDYATELKSVQPNGPYHLGGWCNGGVIAYEMAQQLLGKGDQIGRLILVDTVHPSLLRVPTPLLSGYRMAKLTARRTLMRACLSAELPWAQRLAERIVHETIRRGVLRYTPRRFSGRVTLIRSQVHPVSDDPYLGWQQMAQDGVELRRVAGNHQYLMTRQHVVHAATELNVCLRYAA